MNILIPMAELNSQIVQVLLDNGLVEDEGEIPPFEWPLPDTRYCKKINSKKFFDTEESDVVDILTAIEYVISNLINLQTENILGNVIINSTKVVAAGLLISIGVTSNAGSIAV